MIKYIFYCGFEILKNIKDIRFEFEQVKPSEFSKVINKYQILFVIINRNDKVGPYTSLQTSSRGLDDLKIESLKGY